MLGDSFRLGMFVRPFIAALLLGLTGVEASVAWCFAVCLVACVVLVLLGPDPEKRIEAEIPRQGSFVRRPPPQPADTGESVTKGIRLPAEHSGAGGEDRRRPDGIFRAMGAVPAGAVAPRPRRSLACHGASG